MIRIDPPRQAAVAEAYVRPTNQRPSLVNEQHGRLTVDAAHVGPELTDAWRVEAEAAALGAITFAQLFQRAAAAIDPALFTTARVEPYTVRGRAEWSVREPRLYNLALQRAAREIGERWSDLAVHAEAEITERRSGLWADDADESRSAGYVGAYEPPKPPPPQRPKHSATYLARARLVADGCAQQQIPLAVLDPLAQDIPPEVVLDARATSPIDAATYWQRIEAGFHVAFAPFGRRVVPPQVEVPGCSWRELPRGDGWVLEIAEAEPVAPKAAKSKGGARTELP